MARVVITGSTRGIGLGMAKEFRKLGHDLVISSRGQQAVDAAVSELEACPGDGHISGCACDVSRRADVEALWDHAAATFGGVDIWINNAGTTGPKESVSDLSDADMQAVIDTNIWGTIFGTQIPLAGMEKQGSGKIFNFEGFGSDGMTAAGLTVYGMTKRAVSYFTKSINKEVVDSPVLVGTISPGIVVTDLLDDSRDTDPEQWEKTKRMYNILADRVETVAPYLVERVLAANKPGTAIKWLTMGKAVRRFAMSRFSSRDIMSDGPANQA